MHYYTPGYLIASFDGTTTTYYLTDALGSVLMSFSNNAILGEQMYGPYGNTRYTAGTINTAKGYTGQIQDAVTGLDYYNARYYDPVAGVFLSVDSAQGNQQGFDPYAYVKGNPETLNDPTGHCPRCIGAIAGAIVGAVVATVTIVQAVQTNTFSLGTVGRAVADVGMGAVDGALITSGVGTVAGAAAIGTLIGGVNGVIAHNVDPKHNDGIQSVFESAAMGGITNAIASGFAEGFGPLIGNAARGAGDFLMRAGAQAVAQGVGAATGNIIQQNLAMADGDQQGWDWSSFFWSTGSAMVIGAATQGMMPEPHTYVYHLPLVG